MDVILPILNFLEITKPYSEHDTSDAIWGIVWGIVIDKTFFFIISLLLNLHISIKTQQYHSFFKGAPKSCFCEKKCT